MSSLGNPGYKDFASNSTKKEYAKWFLDHGFNIIPIDPDTKKPVIDEWQRYSFEPLTEQEKKRFLEMVQKGYNYAVLGGQRNLVILDFEDKELLKVWLGESTLNEICAKTLCVNTVHGGLHIYVISDEIPEHKFNPVFVKDGKGIADLQSYSSYVVGVGSCIDHEFCRSNKCPWAGQDYTSCYTLYNELKEIGKFNLKELLKTLAEKGEKLGISLSNTAFEWLIGRAEEQQVERKLEKLKEELAKYNRFAGKTLDAIREEVCKSIKANLDSVQSEKAKLVVGTAYQVVCERKTYEEVGLGDDNSGGDFYTIKTLLNHGVTDVDVIRQLLPPDSKVFRPGVWKDYFVSTLANAWEEVKPYVLAMYEAKEQKMSKKDLMKYIKARLSEALSKQIIYKYGITTYVQKHGMSETLVGIFQWNQSKGIYEPIDESLKRIIRYEAMDILDLLPKFVQDGEGGFSHLFVEVDTALVNSIYNEVRDLTMTEYNDDEEPLRIAFKNYTIEWRTDDPLYILNLYTAEERTEKQYAFHYIPHKIHGEIFNQPVPSDIYGIEGLAKKLCPKTLQAFKQWVGEKWITLFEIIGYTLYPRIKFKLAFMLLGARDSGKSTFLQLVKKALGKNNTASVRINELFDRNNRFAMGFIFHKLVNIASETKEYSIDDIDRFKSMTGGDQVTTDVKYKGPLTFTPYAKLIIATNRLPDVRDKNDDAFWRRWMIIEFPNRFPNDDTWFDRTFTEEEIEGLLTVSIVAFARVIMNGKFDYQQTPEEVKDLWLNNTDSVWSFIRTYQNEGAILIDRTNGSLEVSAKELYRLYKEYCFEHGYTGVSQKTFTKKLAKYFGITSKLKYVRKNEYGEEVRERYYVGIMLTGVEVKPSNGNEKKSDTKKSDTKGYLSEEIRRFIECTGFNSEDIALRLSKVNFVREEDLVKVFHNELDLVKKTEECLPILGFVDNKDGTFEKQNRNKKMSLLEFSGL